MNSEVHRKKNACKRCLIFATLNLVKLLEILHELSVQKARQDFVEKVEV